MTVRAMRAKRETSTDGASGGAGTVRAWLVIVAAALVGLLAIAAISALQEDAHANHRAQTLLARLDAEAHTASQLQWEAIAEGAPSVDTLKDIERSHRRTHEILSDLARLTPHSAHLVPVRGLLAEYDSLVHAELRLLREGRVSEARRFDEARVSPTFEALHVALREANDAHGKTAEQSVLKAALGSALVTLAALLLIGLLSAGFNGARRAAQVEAAEKKALAQSEAYFRSLVQNSTDVTMILESDGTIRYASDSARRILGRPAEELVGTSFLDLTCPDDMQRVQVCFRECLSHPEGVHGTEFRFARESEGWRHLEVIGTNRLEDPTIGGIIVNARDITERKRAEEQVASQSADLAVRNSELAGLHEVAAAVSRETGLDDLLAQALDAIQRIEPLKVYDKGGIMVAEGDRLRLAAYPSGAHTDEFLRLHENLKVGDCLCGLAAQTGEVIVSDDCFEDDRHAIQYDGMPAHGHVIVPLKAMDRVVGVLYLYRPVGAQTSERIIRLLQTVGDYVGTAIENVRLYEQTKELSLRDPLTGLANRRLMHIELENGLARARRLNQPVSVIMLDLDRFKDYNDTYGHRAGDQLLVDIGTIILRQTREMDLAARYGGEEFLIILPDTRLGDAVKAAERIRKDVMNFDFYYDKNKPPAHMTVSDGVASYSKAVTSENQLIEMADKALYEAKRKGRNRVEIARAA